MQKKRQTKQTHRENVEMFDHHHHEITIVVSQMFIFFNNKHHYENEKKNRNINMVCVSLLFLFDA